MKIRNGFVSNSSSSSFVIPKNNIDVDQKKEIFKLENMGFSVFETNAFIIGKTSMDNVGIKDYLLNIKIPEHLMYISTNFGWVFNDFIEEVKNEN
jgi:hypothetical protein